MEPHPPAPQQAGIALGSNLGDRKAHLDAGFRLLDRLDAEGWALRSGLIETQPQDCPPGSPAFLNAVAEIRFAGEPLELLHRLQQLEAELGRASPEEREINAPRPLDLDILYFGSLEINTPELILPHPRMPQRRFVLEPLAQIRPDLVPPGQTQTVSQLLAAISKR